MWPPRLRAHPHSRAHHRLEVTMFQNHTLVSQLNDVHRRELQSDADRHRRVRRDPNRTHGRILRRR